MMRGEGVRELLVVRAKPRFRDDDDLFNPRERELERCGVLPP